MAEYIEGKRPVLEALKVGVPVKRLYVAEGLKGDLTYKGKKCGLILHNGGFYKNIITFVPNVFITKEEIDMALELLDVLLTRCE